MPLPPPLPAPPPPPPPLFFLVGAEIYSILGRDFPVLIDAAKEGVDENVFIYCCLPAGSLPLCVYTQLVMAEKNGCLHLEIWHEVCRMGLGSCFNFVLLGPVRGEHFSEGLKPGEMRCLLG